jgi:hypothetical protein
VNTRPALALAACCLALAALDARAELTLGVHLGSAHLPERDDQNNRNLGLYANGEHWQAGVYRNTLKRTTVYAAGKFALGAGIDMLVGVGTGYKRECEEVTVVTGRWERIEVQPDGSTVRTSGPTLRTEERCRGFSRYDITPVLAFGWSAPVKFAGASPRVTVLLPTPKSSAVVHLSLGWQTGWLQ